MKVFGLTLAAVALADEKLVGAGGKKTPIDRINQLRSHINRLMSDHFSGCKKADQWELKMTGVCNRAENAYNRANRPCSFFDADTPHGGPEERKRRDLDDDVERYSETDAVASIKGITSGIGKVGQTVPRRMRRTIRGQCT